MKSSAICLFLPQMNDLWKCPQASTTDFTVSTQNRTTHTVSSHHSCTCSQWMTASDERGMFKHKYSVNLSPSLPLLQRLLHPQVRFDHVQVLLTRLFHVIARLQVKEMFVKIFPFPIWVTNGVQSPFKLLASSLVFKIDFLSSCHS